MKKILVILSGLLVAIYAYGQTNQTAEGGCDCPACLAEVAGESLTYTLPALQELNKPQAETSVVKQAVEAEAHDHDAGEAGHDEHAGHDHDAEDAGHDEHAGHDHDAEDAGHDEHAGHDHAAEGAGEDLHAGQDHAAGEAGHDEHEGHDHAAESDPHAGHDHAADTAEVDPHAGHDHAADAAEVDPHAGHDHAEGAVEGVEVSAEMAAKIGLQVHEAEGGTVSKSAIFPAEIKLNRDSTASVSPRYASIVREVFAEIGDSVKKGDKLASLENRDSMAVYTLTAPLDGTIISKDLAAGETAGDDKVLFEVADLSSVWADISIFPRYQHLIRKGLSVKFMAHDGHTARGKVKYVSPIISHETRTFTARCVLKGAGEDFTPGAFVRAKVNVETATVPVRVECEAIQNLDGESVVFTPGDHGFVPVVVQCGLADDYSVEIKSGLKPGDQYVAVGAFALKAQMVTSGMDPHAGHGH